jgi:arylsulfatase A-like enzyme
VDAALKHLREARNEGPVFLWLHVFDPHLAYDPPGEWQRRYTPDYHGMFADLFSMRKGDFTPSPEELAYIRGLYDAEVSYVDQELGRFFRELDRVLPGRERMILVTADHGEEFGEHGGWEHGQSMYRELVQVPLVMVPPASRPPARRVVDAQVRMQDVLPTLLDAGGVEPPKGLPGTSLFPWFEGSALNDDLVAYSEREHLGPRSAALRDGKHALILYLDEGRMELYDQIADPAEANDLAAVHPDRVRALRERLDATAKLFEEIAADLEAHQGVELSPAQWERMRSLGYTDG